ncbi:MAG: ATP-binding protein [Eubacteriales bacterium]
MKFTFRTKFIIINLAIVLLTMLILTILVVQGLMYYNITSSQKRLLDDSIKGVFYIQQEVKTDQKSKNYETTFISKSVSIAENLASANDTRVLLYDADGNLITDSANVEVGDDIDLDEEVSLALDDDVQKGQSVSKYKRLEDISRIYNLTPILIDDKKIGVVAFIYSLEFMDDIVQKVVMLFQASSFISIIIIAVLGHYLTKSILKPIEQLVDSTKRVSQGNFTELIDYHTDDEIGELTSNFNKMTLNMEDKINQIEEEKQKLTSIISSIDDGVIAVSLNKKVLFFNDKAKEILNIPMAANLLSYNDVPFLLETFIEVAEREEEIIKQLDHAEKHLLIYGNLMKSDMNSIGILLVVRDITKLYQLEKQQRQFVSSVSHELRTPLTTIIGYTDLLMRRGTDNVELLNKSLDTINSEGQRLLRLVDDLLSLSKYQNTEFKLIFNNVDINTLLEDVVTQMKIKSTKYNIDILYNSVELPIIPGDYDRLKQVFINILDNAIKYSNSKEVIKVMASYYDNDIEISIRDYGSGISQEQLEYIFSPFYRVDENRSRELGGTGLGLSIVKRIVERHRGHVHIESKLGEGTMVVVQLPIYT